VTALVDGCTEPPGLPKAQWKERKCRYIEQLRVASLGSRRISLADKLNNARATLADWYRVGDLVWDRFRAGKDESLWFYSSVVEVLAEGALSNSPMLHELARIIEHLRGKSTTD